MSSPRYTALVRKLLVQQDVSAPPAAPPAPRERARSIAAIERALVAKSRRRRTTRWAAGAMAAAAGLACVLGASRYMARHAGAPPPPALTASGVQIVAHPAAGGASVIVSGARAPLVEGRALPAGSHIVTPPNGRATLSFSTGTSVALGEGTDLSIEDESGSQMLRLSGGFVDLHVAKLGPDQRFLVETADAEVEVRGTRFRVGTSEPDPSCGGGAATRVTVSEGVVVVRHAGVEARVEAGGQWPAGCVAPTVAPQSAAAGPKFAAGPARPAVAARAPASDLAVQNDLFAEARAARRRGDVQGALAAFDRLLAKYPGYPLAENACAERMRLLRSVAPERAAARAREYLVRYPAGFARSEAEALVQAGAPAGP